MMSLLLMGCKGFGKGNREAFAAFERADGSRVDFSNVILFDEYDP